MPIHRTAIFTLHHPTRQVRAALDAAFAQYTAAYTEALHRFAHLTPGELCAMATIGTDAHGRPRTSARWLEPRLFAHQNAVLLAALQPLEGGLRESLRRHVARTFLSYAALALGDATHGTPRGTTQAATHTEDHLSVVAKPRSAPTRLRARDVEPQRREALTRLATLVDGLEEQQACIAQLQRTAQPSIVPLPFCRVDAERNCGLFYNPETRRFYARLYVMSYHSRYARHITAAGQYVDLRSGALYMREQDAAMWQGIHSFGTGRSSILVPLEIGRWHEEPLRFSDVVLLPQRQCEHPVSPLQDRPLQGAVPVSA